MTLLINKPIYVNKVQFISSNENSKVKLYFHGISTKNIDSIFDLDEAEIIFLSDIKGKLKIIIDKFHTNKNRYLGTSSFILDQFEKNYKQ